MTFCLEDGESFKRIFKVYVLVANIALVCSGNSFTTLALSGSTSSDYTTNNQPWDSQVLEWCLAWSVLPLRRRCLFSLGWPPIQWWCHNINSPRSWCLITLTSLVSHRFLLVWFTSISQVPQRFLLGWSKLNKGCWFS